MEPARRIGEDALLPVRALGPAKPVLEDDEGLHAKVGSGPALAVDEAAGRAGPGLKPNPERFGRVPVNDREAGQTPGLIDKGDRPRILGDDKRPQARRCSGSGAAATRSAAPGGEAR